MTAVTSSRPQICSAIADGELLTCELEETATLELFLECLALGFGALEQSVGMAERVGQRFVR